MRNIAMPICAQRRCRGVTLLEILVAIAILAVGISAVMQVFPMGYAASNKSTAQVMAYELAARRLEEARSAHLFGGIPSNNDVDRYRYWGNMNAPNPDGNVAKEVNTAGRFVAFDNVQAPEDKFFYRVECLPVVDTCAKYLEFPFESDDPGYSITNVAENFRGFATMYRITVTVRGPLASAEQAADANWHNYNRAAVEANLSTMFANRSLGDCLLAEEKRLRKQIGAQQKWNVEENGRFLYVKGFSNDYPYPEDFSVLYKTRLALEEETDSGPTVVGNDGSGNMAALPRNVMGMRGGVEQRVYGDYFTGEGLNRLGLDNIVIFREVVGTTPTEYIAETNKLIGIHPPNKGPFPSATYWTFELLNDLYGADGDYAARPVPIMDSTYNGANVITDGYIGYDAGQYSKTGGVVTITGTRVRFLMKMEYRP